MAAFANIASNNFSRTIPTHAQRQQSRPSAAMSPSKGDGSPSELAPKPPQRGACNFRDLAGGHQCGCTTFWVDSRQRRDRQIGLSGTQRNDEDVSDWCFCGHHACYHHVSRTPNIKGQQLGKQARLVEENGGLYLQFESREADRPFNTSADSQLSNRLQRNSQKRSPAREDAPVRPEILNQRSCRVEEGDAALEQKPSLQAFEGANDGLHQIPAPCLLSGQNGQIIEHGGDGVNVNGLPVGLGLSLLGRHLQQEREMSIPSTIQFGPGDTEAGSTRQNTPASEQHVRRTSPSQAFRNQIIQARRIQPNVEVPVTTAEYVNSEDIIQSATEVATPSIANNTPDLRPIEQYLNEANHIADSLAQRLGDNAQPQNTENRLLLPDSPAIPQAPLKASGTSVDSVLAKLGIHLSSLQSHLESYPSVSASLKTLAGRIDNLENMSFSHIQTQDVVDQFEQLDTRLLELESWKTDHDKIHEANDRENGSSIHGSFNAYGYGEHQCADPEEIAGIKERLDDLECALPSASNPWTVEVVLLPWGRELRGIWFLPDDATNMQDATTQDTEEWTQARSTSSARPSLHNPTSSHSGWSYQDISGWADNTEEWLSPKACGPKNVAYQRLRSRGFVRKMQLTSANAGDIQATIAKCFAPLSEHPNLPFGDFVDDAGDDEVIGFMPGLKAAFIPLRKIFQSPRLRFLSTQEMATSALWTAQFLSSGVLMRASGNVKRLYVTHRDAYLQQSSNDDPWTWQQIRELPRIAADTPAPAGEAADDANRVGEADAKEACWTHNPNLDPTVSVESSFASMSFQSTHIAQGDFPVQEVAHNRSARQIRTSEPQSQSSNRSRNKQPISPVSEFHPRRITFQRANQPTENEQPEPRLSSSARITPSRSSFQKRRIASFQEAPSGPIASPPSKAKRRRVSHSPLPPASPPATHAQLASNPDTPRKPRDASSPFFEREPVNITAFATPAVDQINSRGIVTSHAGTSVAHSTMASKRGRTPNAYMTPHSGTVIMPIGDDSEPMDVEGDTEVDSDGESWNGVDEETGRVRSRSASSKSSKGQQMSHNPDAQAVRRRQLGDDVHEGFDEDFSPDEDDDDENDEGSDFEDESEDMELDSD